MGERPLVQYPPAARSNGRDFQAVMIEGSLHLRDVQRSGGGREDLHGIEAVLGGAGTSIGQAIVEYKRTLPGFRDKADGNGRFHPAINARAVCADASSCRVFS